MRETSCWTIRQAKARKCNPATVAVKRSQSRARRRKRLAEVKERSTTQRRSQLGHLRAVLCIGRRDVQREQVAQRIDGGVKLCALLPLGSVAVGSRSALRRALQRATIEDRRGRTLGLALAPAQQHAQVVDHLIEDAAGPPALGLLVDRLSGRELVLQHPHWAPVRTSQRTALKTSRRA